MQPLTLNADKSFNLNHLYADNGSYTVTVTVTDDDGAARNDTLVVSVANVAPIINAGSDASVPRNMSFIQTGSFTDPGADSWTATVNYGDGAGTQTLTLNPNKTFTLQHNYTAAGHLPGHGHGHRRRRRHA